MQNPLQVTFHDLDHHQDIENLIDEKFKKLQSVSPEITKCHIVLERLSKHHQKANMACVRLDLKVTHFDDIVIKEKCADDLTSIKSAVLKIFKNTLVKVREEAKRRRNFKRSPKEDLVSAPLESPEEE